MWKKLLVVASALVISCSAISVREVYAAVLTPTASGVTTYEKAGVTMDASNSSQGYVMVKYTGGASKIKVQIEKAGSETYTYDLNARSSYEVFPLTAGNGTYTLKVLENVRGNEYMLAFSQGIQVELVNAFTPFLYPNQYVNFTANSAAVQKGAELAGADKVGTVNNVYNYVISNITYDTVKAQTVQSGYLPNVDNVLAQKKGICFDYAALMTAMLRSQDIPTKLVIGYTGGVYHAWIDVYIDGIGWINNAIYFDGNDWELLDPTFASTGGQNFVVNKADYQVKYSY